MRCVKCKHPDTHVDDTRLVKGGRKRVRKCLKCGHRFPTMERLAAGRRQPSEPASP